MALPRAFHHLLSSHQAIAVNAGGLKSEEDVLQIVLSFMEVEKADFDFERPLLSYGLDSLSATRLSSALQPFIPVTQVQLLAGVSWSELRVSLQTSGQGPVTHGIQPMPAQEILMAMLNVDETDFDPNIPLVSYGLDSLSFSKLATALYPYLPVTPLQLLAHTSWADLLTATQKSVPEQGRLSSSGDTIVELCTGTGIPLILFAGANGSVAPLLPLRTYFSGTLWGVQATESMPNTSLSALSAFFVQKIREKQPNGPYRLAAYSASSVISVAVAKLLEDSGHRVLQLSFIDHFPLLWTAESTEKLLRELEMPALIDGLMTHMIEMLREDPLYRGSDSQAALSASSQDMTRRVAAPLLQFLIDFYPRNAERSRSGITDSLTLWISSVKAPLSVLIAEYGMITMLPTALHGPWADLGASRCHTPVRKHIIPGTGHYGILADQRTASFLQQYN